MANLRAAYEARLKRRAAAHPELYPEYSYKGNKKAVNHNMARLLDLLRDKPFWIWDEVEHEEKRKQTGNKCCWNDIIGLPENKPNLPRSLFPYQKVVVEAYEQHKNVWIKKATNMGVTELTLRWLAYLATRNNDYQGCQMCVVCAPRVELAITLMNRMRAFFASHNVTFDMDKTMIDLNKCHIQVYPGHHLHSMRGLTEVVAIYLDEADFFPVGMQVEARAVSERYIAKGSRLGQPLIIWSSTPNNPMGLFETIEKDENSLYHKIFLHYSLGLGYIYTEQDITAAKKSISFPREYELQYLGTEGNVFSHEVIERAKSRGLEPHGALYEPTALHLMGVDVAFGSGVSNSAITVVQAYNSPTSKLQVMHSEELEAPDFNYLVHRITVLTAQYRHVSNIYVDASAPSVISSVKKLLHDFPADNYLEHIANLEKQYKTIAVERWVRVIPISFGQRRKEMLAKVKIITDDSRGILAISPKYERLIGSLRGAVSQENNLLKTESPYNDSLDSLMLACCGLLYKPQQR